MKDVKDEITYFCIAHCIEPRFVTMNISMCGLEWVLEDLASKIYLSKIEIDNTIREKIKILLIFAETSPTIFELIDDINNTNNVHEKLKFWNQYFDILKQNFSKFEGIYVFSTLYTPGEAIVENQLVCSVFRTK